MNFFKSVFADELSASGSDSDPLSPPADAEDPPGESPDSVTGSTGGGAWSFGDLMKTIAARSESVIHHYREDIEEFKSGLRKETAVIREAASRAVKDLPASLEVGASVAQESLESVGQAIDDIGATVWSSTAQIVSHSKEALRDFDLDSTEFDYSSGNTVGSSQLLSYGSHGLDSKKYSRFDAQLLVIQSDVDTYCREPEDKEDYRMWKLGFIMEEKNAEIASLIQDSEIIGDIYSKVVPESVDNDTFWGRYFYRVHKLKQAEDARSRLVKRAISGEEDEELRWDYDAEDDVAEGGLESRKVSGSDEEVSEEAEDNKSEGKEKAEDSSRDSDVSIVSTQPSIPEEDLGWDEIEDVVSNEEGKGDDAGASGKNRADLRKRLSAADEEEDLSWDIDDEESEPAKDQ